MRYFKTSDGIPRLRVRGVGAGASPSMNNAPVQVRTQFGELEPGPNGGPGSPLWPYSENLMYGNSGNSAGTITPPPAVGAIAPASGQGTGSNSPNGEADREWFNPTSFTTVSLLGQVGGNIGSIFPAGQNYLTTPVLQLSYKRNCLIIQNNSLATSPDVAPNFYIDFNKQPTPQSSLSAQGYLTLPPGLGILFDTIVPRDAIYVTFGPFTGLATFIVGSIIQGTWSPPANA